MKILLGKKLRLVIFGLLLVAILGFLASQPNRSHYEGKGIVSIENSSKKIQSATLNQITKRDSDNDGLKDWEEELWGTDPNNPDTDGDGTNDGDEVDVGRNPNIAGPDDEYQDSVFVKQENTDFSNENLTETEKFSQDIFGNYLSKRVSDVPLTETDKSELINSALQNISDLQIQQYTVSDILISDDISKAAVRNYGNMLGEIILKHSFKTENELTIFNRSLVSNDKEEIKKLDPIINGYKNILKEALVVQVPQDAVEEHMAFIYSTASTILSIESMRTIYDDPIRAMVGMEEHRQSVLLLINAFDNIKSYFRDKDIVFSEGESGIILTDLI